MANKRAKEMREKLDSELSFDLEQMEKDLFEMRFKSSSEGVTQSHRIRDLKRDIARAKTLLHERSNGIRGAASKT